MYDQNHYGQIYFFQFYLDREQYVKMKEISSYAPEGWILYTQATPKPFFFGAYPEESLIEEAETEFSNLKKEEYVNGLMEAYHKMFDKAKTTSKYYFKEFYKKEKEVILNNPQKVIDFINGLKNTVDYFYSYYLLTQPQRFFRVEEEVNKLKDPSLMLLLEYGGHLTKMSELRKSILTLAKDISKSGLTIEKYFRKCPGEQRKADSTIENYGFLTWDLLGGELLTKNNLNKSLTKLLKNIEEIEAEYDSIIKIENKIKERNSIKYKGDLYRVADIVGNLLVNRFDTNTFILCLVNYYIQFINALREEYGLKELDIQSYTLNEIINLIKNKEKVSNEVIEKRKKGYLNIHYKDKFEVYEGEEAKNRIKELLEYREKSHMESKCLNGVVASFPDKNNRFVIGEVFVMTSNYNADEQLKLFREGQILVTTQTHPALVHIVKKSSAVFTDEGGLTCHAAIVSRELGKPCIIGTHLATKVLKTGDKIKMDLETGEVVKISN